MSAGLRALQDPMLGGLLWQECRSACGGLRGAMPRAGETVQGASAGEGARGGGILGSEQGWVLAAQVNTWRTGATRTKGKHPRLGDPGLLMVGLPWTSPHPLALCSRVLCGCT